MDWTYLWQLFKTVLGMGRSLLLAIPTFLSIASLLLTFFLPRLEGGKTKSWLEKVRNHPALVCMSFLMLSVILASHSLYANKTPKFATPDKLTQSVLTSRDVRVADLTRESPTIRYKTFVNCTIYGPAMILINNPNYFSDVGIEGTMESCLVETTNRRLIGVIVLESCTFKNCKFRNVGFIGDPERMAILRTLISAAQKKLTILKLLEGKGPYLWSGTGPSNTILSYSTNDVGSQRRHAGTTRQG